jgi:molybdenum cofactor cytidylyltransferase
MSPPRFAAVVLAGGHSSRLPPLKPLLPVDGVAAVVRSARTFRDVGVEPLVVVGYAAEEIIPALVSADLRHVVNADYGRGMYSSLLTGVRALNAAPHGAPDWLFVQPADCPVVRGETIGRLMRTAAVTGRGAPGAPCPPPRALAPFCHESRGHPPLLSAALLPVVMEGEPPGGLRVLLDDLGDGLLAVPVDDEGVLLDMDDPDGYALVAAQAVRERLPDADACEALLRRRATPAAVAAHSRRVRDVALRLAGAANAAGLGVDLRLLTAAALTHDVARERPGHADAAAAALEEEGYARVARVVARHMTLSGPPAEPPGETELLYLADKLVRDDALVTLEERRREAVGRFADEPAARAAADLRLRAAAAIARSLERATGRPLADLLADQPTQPGGGA